MDVKYALRMLLVTTLSLVTLSANATPIVGFTPGEFSVDASGSANYHIPLAVPPGSGGMAPSLSLSYNSNTGNGLLGHGWTLGGLSVITRCPATKVQDGFIDGVDYDDNDRYCIDGQRLIAIQGTYGANNTEYRTELDGFTKVISYDTNASEHGPEYFVAYTKSGQTLEYGNTTDSQIEAQGKSHVRLWAVNKIQDTVGNYLTVSYQEDNSKGNYKPTRIDYTGNTQASLSPYAYINFVYEDRADVTTGYFSGSKIVTDKRLKTIQTFSENNLTREYHLTYDNQGATQRSRITEVQECDGSNECFDVTAFISNISDNGFLALTDERGQIKSFGGSASSATKFFFGDYNGDGLTDYIYWNWGAHNGKFRIYLSKGDGTFQFSGDVGGSASSATKFFFGDYNGDGLTDYIYWNWGAHEGRFHAYINRRDHRLEIDDIKTPLTSTLIDYTPLTDEAVYTKGSGAVYPEVDIQGPMYVVSKVTVDDGIGGTRDTTYTYEGLKSSYLRGSLGFNAMTATDILTGIVTRTDYNQSYPYIGHVQESTETYNNGTATNNDDVLLSKLTNSYQHIQTHTGNETVATHPGVLFPYANQVVKENYELNTGGLVSTITTTQSYDTFGNPTDITVTSQGQDADDNPESYVTQTTNTYTNDTSNWYLGRLTRTDVTNTLADNTTQTRSSSFEYDATTGLLTIETIEPDNPALRLITQYDYDFFGNKTKATVSGGQ